jgi:PPM family protein phosphatase
MNYTTRSVSYRGEQTEDIFLVMPLSENLLCAVADGVGGRPGGREASHFVREQLLAKGADLGRGRAQQGQHWLDFVQELDEELLRGDIGQTTFVALTIEGRSIFGVSVGDSEAWWVTENDLVVLTAHQQRKPFLGSGASGVTFKHNLQGEGILLLATDGLFKYAQSVDILTVLRQEERDLETRADALVALARGKSSGQLYDDLALVLVEVEPT